ncbi:hypothetical protein ACFE04_024545 [Oxalis oulophora]
MALEEQEQKLTLTAAAIDGGEDGGKTPRLPRWTRQEILVLIQGKRVAESRVRRGNSSSSNSRMGGIGSGLVVEPKWASVSSYCKRHGVIRGPVQCRKRWSNLAGDYKKIKEWESSMKEETESFWVMRNDLRRERKLPGFFDKEVFDILDAPPAAVTTVNLPLGCLELGLAPSSNNIEEEEVETVVFDSGRSATAADDGLFSDFEQDDDAAAAPAAGEASIPAPIPISEKQYEPLLPNQLHQGNDFFYRTNEKEQATNPEVGSASQDARKRKRLATDGEEEASVQSQLIDVLEKNGRMLSAQLEAQNNNFQLDREQRKDYADNIVSVLSKLADAIGKIADKL